MVPRPKVSELASDRWAGQFGDVGNRPVVSGQQGEGVPDAQPRRIFDQKQSILGKRQRPVAQGPQVSDQVCSLVLIPQAREDHVRSRQGECRV